MTTIYIISNNYTLKCPLDYGKEISKEQLQEYLPLSKKGEQLAMELSKKEELKETISIYASNHFSMINTAKYLSEERNLTIHVDERLKERKVGILGNNNEKFLKETQEHDFDYKFHNGESLNQVQERMKNFLKEVLSKHQEEVITLFTHDIATEALLSIWCEKGFNLENQMILNFKEKVIIDGAYHPYRLLKLEFDEMKLKEIVWMNTED